MDVGEFILGKMVELKEEYRWADFKDVESVMLVKNGTVTQFNSEQTPLIQKGKEVKLSELQDGYTGDFKANGSLIRFEVLLPKKRKPTILEYYFLWED